MAPRRATINPTPWRILFASGYDYLRRIDGGLSEVGWQDDAKKLAFVRGAWKRLGPEFLARGEEPRWALEKFGKPAMGGIPLVPHVTARGPKRRGIPPELVSQRGFRQ